jgi:alpha-glucosidase (family GH31 glycosyl hydrolase)
MPPIRPMWLVDAAERWSPHADNQWLVGDDVLVAPVLERGAVEREVRFPAGCWQREGSGERVVGPLTKTVAAPLSALPWFVRCDTRPF